MEKAAGCEHVKPTDEELVKLIRAGDERAFAELYGRYRLGIFRLAYAMTGSPETAEDVTQEVFLRVYEKLHRFHGQAKFSTWLYRLAVNCCLNHCRRERAGESLAQGHRVQGEEPEPMEAKVLGAQIRDRVHRAILSLPPELRVTVILKEIEGLNYAEIARRMGCSEGTVASRLNRARKLLARKLEHLRGAF